MTNKFMQYLEEQEKKKKSNKSRAKIFWFSIGFLAFSCIVLIVSFYFYYSREAFYIFPAKGQSKTEVLGQAGDYFGGILNPVFGLITIILILKNSRQQFEDEKHSKNAKELEILDALIEAGHKELHKRIEGTYFWDDDGINFSFNSTLSRNHPINTKHRQHLEELTIRLYSGSDSVISERAELNTSELVKIRDIIETIFRAHHEIIKLETHELVQNYYATQLNHLLGDLYRGQLIPSEIVKAHEDLLDKAIPYRSRHKIKVKSRFPQ